MLGVAACLRTYTLTWGSIPGRATVLSGRIYTLTHSHTRWRVEATSILIIISTTYRITYRKAAKRRCAQNWPTSKAAGPIVANSASITCQIRKVDHLPN